MLGGERRKIKWGEEDSGKGRGGKRGERGKGGGAYGKIALQYYQFNRFQKDIFVCSKLQRSFRVCVEDRWMHAEFVAVIVNWSMVRWKRVSGEACLSNGGLHCGLYRAKVYDEGAW